ncbi:MAG: acyloxyacyl hydrolase [Flavisolibacter sp.]
MIRKVLPFFFCTMILLQCFFSNAQDSRTQYPSFLSNSYFNVNIGYINYPFSSAQLEPGYNVGSVKVPHVAARIVLLGHQFNKYVSAQVSYMRPVNFVQYKSINGDGRDYSVWMHFGSLTLKSQLPLSKNFSIYGEGGLGIVTRKGFEVDNKPVVKNASYGTVFLGAGFEYHLNKKWDLLLSTSYSPPREKYNQPHSIFYSAGFRYNMRPLSMQQVENNSKGDYIFPKNLLQVGYSNNVIGYGINNFVSETIPIFWGGDVQIKKGLTLRYQRNIFHTRKVFAFNIGASTSWWQSKLNKDEFFSLALSPIFQFNIIRTRPVDVYLFYSAAGPSYLSKTFIDGGETGRHFTFQDFMGMGFFVGKKKNINAEININHYSNGNIFTDNPGLKIPTTFTLGYAF